jgi:predicted nucleic acid-binding protein
MKLVSNTGPLIALSHISKLELLPLLFSEVKVPLSVYEEFNYKGNVKLPDGIKIEKVEKVVDSFLKEKLDRGEREVITLSVEEHPDYVLIDERKGRKIAELYYHLPIVGTSGLLLMAKKRGLIKEVKPLLNEIRDNGYFISNQIYELTLNKAGE